MLWAVLCLVKELYLTATALRHPIEPYLLSPTVALRTPPSFVARGWTAVVHQERGASLPVVVMCIQMPTVEGVIVEAMVALIRAAVMELDMAKVVNFMESMEEITMVLMVALIKEVVLVLGMAMVVSFFEIREALGMAIREVSFMEVPG